MTVLTQRNAAIIFALQVAWGSILASGLLPHRPWVDAITVGLNAITAALAFLGFNRTPQGNILPPAIVTEVDRQAVVSKAGDAIIDAAAKKVTEENKP